MLREKRKPQGELIFDLRSEIARLQAMVHLWERGVKPDENPLLMVALVGHFLGKGHDRSAPSKTNQSQASPESQQKVRVVG